MDKLASLLARHALKNNDLSTLSYETYKYSFLIFLETLSGIMTGGVIAVCLNLKWETVIFLLVFGSLRVYAGGIHCKTFAKCYVGSSCIMLGALWTVKYLSIAAVVSFPILIVSMAILTLFKPANNDNRPVRSDEAIYFKINLFKVEIAVLLLYLICMKLGKIQYGGTSALAAAIVSLLMLMGRWKKE